MATSKEFCEYAMEQLRPIGCVSARPMMGEYMIYYRGKLVGGLYDNCLLLKPNAALEELLPDAERVYPYEGSKTLMYVVEQFEDTDFMSLLFRRIYEMM